MITPEMYRNALNEIERLKAELRQCRDIGNNLIEENARLQFDLDAWKSARTWAETP